MNRMLKILLSNGFRNQNKIRRKSSASLLYLTGNTMKYTLAFLLFCLFLNIGNSQIGQDKVLHFAGGALFGLAGAGIAKEVSNGDPCWTFVGAVGGALLVGLGKEAVDAGQEGNQWDNKDVLATALGGVAVGITIEIFRNKKKKRFNLSTYKTNDNLDFDLKKRIPSLNELQFSNSMIYTE